MLIASVWKFNENILKQKFTMIKLHHLMKLTFQSFVSYTLTTLTMVAGGSSEVLIYGKCIEFNEILHLVSENI